MIRIEFEPLSDMRDEHIRARQLLKYALRAQRMRCCMIAWLDDEGRPLPMTPAPARRLGLAEPTRGPAESPEAASDEPGAADGE